MTTSTNRIVRHRGHVVREQDVVNFHAHRGASRDAAMRLAARCPEVEGNPISFGQFLSAVTRQERVDAIAVMSSEPDNGDRFY